MASALNEIDLSEFLKLGLLTDSSPFILSSDSDMLLDKATPEPR